MKYINCDLFPQKSSVNKPAFLFYHDVKRYCIMFLRLNLILFKMNRKENSHLLFNNCTIKTQKVLVVCYETEQNNNRYNQYTCMYYIFKECTWTLTFAMEVDNIATKKERGGGVERGVLVPRMFSKITNCMVIVEWKFTLYTFVKV